MDLKIKKLTPTAKIPKRMTEHSAGADIYCDIKEELVLKAGSMEMIPTGVAISLPENFEAQIRPRSGLAFKNQISVLNSPGTIDADYRGEIKVLLFNFGKKDFILKPDTRIAQMVIAKYSNVNFNIVENLDETERGSGGFGHTESK